MPRRGDPPPVGYTRWPGQVEKPINFARGSGFSAAFLVNIEPAAGSRRLVIAYITTG